MSRALSDQVREIPQSFGWIDRNLIHLGFLAEMSRHEFILYAFLCLASDRWGMSYWGVNKSAKLLKISHNSLEKARQALRKRGLIEFEKDKETGRIRYQVLPLPVERIEVVRRLKPQAGTDKSSNSHRATGRKPLRSSDRKYQTKAKDAEDAAADAIEVRRQIRQLLKLDEPACEPD